MLLTTAGMQPLKPYFLGQEKPPHPRLTTCQKCFRTTDIEKVGNTTRHLTFFEMLGNFSIGDYFKQGAVEFAWELSLEGFGLRPRATSGSRSSRATTELGLGPDEEAIEAWREVGVPRERIVRLPAIGELLAGRARPGPCGPCSELYLDRGLEFGGADDLPGRRQRALPRVLEPRVHAVRPGPGRHARRRCRRRTSTPGSGSTGMARDPAGRPSVFETDQFRPLIDAGRGASGAATARRRDRPRAAHPRRPHARR